MHIVNILLAVSVVLLVLGYFFWDRASVYSTASTVAGAIAFVGLVGVVLFGIGSAILTVESNACRTQADDLDRDFRYGLVVGCRVETDDGSFVPIENLRITNEES